MKELIKSTTSQLLITIMLVLSIIGLLSLILVEAKSTQNSIAQVPSSQKTLTKQVNTLQSRVDTGEVAPNSTNSTVKTTPNDVSIKTTVAGLDKAQSIINSNPNAWVDIQLGHGMTIFANKKGAGFDISHNIYSEGTYTINGKAYKALKIVPMKYNGTDEWNLLKNSKSNEAYIISQNNSNESLDNVLFLEQA